jgi:hypothetical protein
MTPSDAEAWARLRLVQGRANAQLWELVQSAGQSTLTVGASAGCSWPVADRGVAPIHFTLHWDGRHLHAADTYGAGDVRVDGEPLDRQFRVLTGRSRIDFGHAAIVVETSIHNPSEPAHPLDPGPLPAPAAGVSRSSPPRSHAHQTTLLGVSAMAPVRGMVGQPAPSEQAPSSSRPPHGSAPKGTLMGMTPVPDKAAGAPSSMGSGAGVQNGVRSARGMGATLMGVGADVIAAAVANARAATAASASLADGDQRTAQGFPADGQRVSPPSPNHSSGRRDTQQGLFSAAAGVAFEAVKEARVKSISGTSSPMPASASAHDASTTVVTREGRTTWEEIPAELGRTHESGPTYAAVPVSADVLHQAVLVDSAQYAATEPPHPPASSYAAADETWRQRRATAFSDAPTEMRDVTPFESKRPNRPIPWQYVGLGVLTAIAYIAWLYLLDHF